MRGLWAWCVALLAMGLTALGATAAPVGYYRQPHLHRDTLVFVAEGDLWRVPAGGGVAMRLTSHSGEETTPRISPDGQTIAFVAEYEGPSEVYTISISGGLPTRRTYDGEARAICGWTPDGRVLYATRGRSTLPDVQLVALDVSRPEVAGVGTILPLAQASEGAFDENGATLFFTRLPFQGSHTKRYKGGTAQNLWRFATGDPEATPLTLNYAGTSKCPMPWAGRIYFASDRDGTMNLWSMKPNGTDLKQHTRHSGWDVLSPTMSEGRIAYQLGADIHVYEIAAAHDAVVKITLNSDLDQMRENWVKRPMDYVTSAHLSPDGDRVALTARGQVFVLPHRQGRIVEATHQKGVRYREGRFMPDGKTLLALSDGSGEVEFCKMPANGVGAEEQLTSDGQILRWQGLPSPNGKLIAHHDKDQRLFILDVEKKSNRMIGHSDWGGFEGLRWSPDSKWLAYVSVAENQFKQVCLYNIEDSASTVVTTDRYDSYSPAWSADGKWLYLLSDRNLKSAVSSPWGSYQPEPFLDRKSQLFLLPLERSLVRSPFAPKDELSAEKADNKKETAQTRPSTRPAQTQAAKKESTIDLAGIQHRLMAIAVPAGNYHALYANDKALFWLSTSTETGRTSLLATAISSEGPEVRTVAEDVSGYELSQDGKKILLRKAGSLYIIDAVAAPADLARKEVNLSRWTLSVTPRQEWRQMFREAWRLERDYFYDRGMHGVDWKAMLAKYEPLVDRVTTRAELSDLISQMVSELCALHIFVRGGDVRRGDDDVATASLGAVLERDESRGGYRVTHIYPSDPDEPTLCSPLARPGVDVKQGDVIEMINGVATLSVPDIGMLLRRRADQQVLARIKPADGAAPREVIVTPISSAAATDLRYHAWEYTRRQVVEEKGQGKLGYVHLRAMGGANFTEWAKNFYPVWNREGLIIDVRHNRGGNIDSWIIGRLLRKAWFFWSERVGQPPSWNMQWAFRGHLVVLCNEFTASDGEAFCEGIKRLKLGTVIGTRTWGGEIWLSSSNVLVDHGIATAAENGVYGPEGQWLIEGHGVEPDIAVDNPPHATFKGEDAQLAAAVAYLQKKIREQPIEKPRPPRFPNKAVKYEQPVLDKAASR